jgi:DNA transformation protein and related proteins
METKHPTRAMLNDLYNIGPSLADRLVAAGICTAEELVRVGDEEAFRRLQDDLPHAVRIHTRLALAGAVRGLPWRQLSIAERERLTAGVHGDRGGPNWWRQALRVVERWVRWTRPSMSTPAS